MLLKCLKIFISNHRIKMYCDIWSKMILLVGFIICFISKTEVYGLECYACNNQDSNVDKCIKTTKQCEEHQDICMTHIKWGLPPYWIPYGTRQHYVWKDCDTRSACEQKRLDTIPKCKRDWFDDWECYECCTGDMCNYFVTLDAGRLQSSTGLMCLTLSLLFVKWAI